MYNLFSVTFYLSQMLYLKLDTFHLPGWLQAEDPQSAGVGGVCRGQLGRALQPQHRPHEGQQHGEQVTADCNLVQQLHNLAVQDNTALLQRQQAFQPSEEGHSHTDHL